jgi:hypothetical protein
MSYIDEENFSGFNSGTPSGGSPGEGMGFFGTLAVVILVLVGLATVGFFTQEINTDFASFFKFAKVIALCIAGTIAFIGILFGAIVLVVLMLSH